VVAVDGTYDDAFDLCVEACEAFGWYNRSTALNPYTIEGKKTVSFEIYEQLGDRSPDMVIVPTGDGCILSGVAQGFRNLRQLGRIDRMPRLVAVQAEGSDAIVRMVEGVHPDADFRARSIADSITVSVPRNGRMAARDVLESGGRAIRVSDDAILAAVSELASWTGIFAEPAAAAALAGLRVLLALEEVPPDASVVLLITGSGLKDPRAAASVAAEPILVGRSLLELRKALDHCGATEGAW
jgi:threonine synthase